MNAPVYLHPELIKQFKAAGLDLPAHVVAAESIRVRPAPRVTSENVAEVLRKLRRAAQ